MAEAAFGAGAPGTSWGLLSGNVDGTYRTIQYKNASIALLACATVFTGLRMFTRLFVVNNTGPDDYLACLGLPSPFKDQLSDVVKATILLLLKQKDLWTPSFGSEFGLWLWPHGVRERGFYQDVWRIFDQYPWK
ncbi:MAG: hypothetical protein Q9227_008130 [Pyrenula ochraceoflavens]